MKTPIVLFLTWLSMFSVSICTASKVEYKTLKEDPRPPGCYYKGAYYRPNSEILIVEEKEANLCYGIVCNDQGDIIHWDDFKCFSGNDPLPRSRPKRYRNWHRPRPTSGLPPPKRPHPIPMPRPTKPPGCEHNGKHYSPGEEISKGVDGDCSYGMFCSEDGQLVAWDGRGCFHSETTTTTTGPPPERR